MLSKLFPQVYLVYILLAGLALAGMYAWGRSDGSDICTARITELVAESAVREKQAQLQAQKASQELEAARGKTEIKYKTITKEVEKLVDRPVYRNVCLDADGLRLANSALRPDAPSGEPIDPLQ